MEFTAEEVELLTDLMDQHEDSIDHSTEATIEDRCVTDIGDLLRLTGQLTQDRTMLKRIKEKLHV